MDSSGTQRVARNGYRSIARVLTNEIESGAVEPGAFLPTERELQHRFSASRATIRKSLAALIDGGWARSVPNRGVVASRGLQVTDSKQIALIEGDSYVLRVLGVRLAERLMQRGYHLVPIGGSMESPIESAIMRAHEKGFGGAVVWPYRGFSEKALMGEAGRRMPLVTLDHRLDGIETDLVTFDYERAAYEATEQLIKQGARRIGVTGMLDMLEVNHARFRGYMRAMFAYDRQPLARDYLFTSTSGQDEPDPLRLEQGLSSADRPDALFVFSDSWVPSTIETALKLGLRVPEDLKIATVGDDLEIDIDGIGMTAVALDWDAMIDATFELLMDRLANVHRSTRTRLVPHRLIVRGLCGAPQNEWTATPESMTGLRGQLPFPKSRYRYATGAFFRSDVP